MTKQLQKKIQPLLKKMRESRGEGWYINEFGGLRRISEVSTQCPQCPLTFFAGLGGCGKYGVGASRLNLTLDETRTVLAAADGVDTEKKSLRKLFLKAVGL